MTKSKNILIAIALLCSTFVNAQHTLKIEITNLRSNKGLVSVELLDKDNTSVKGKTQSIKENKCVIIFNDLKEGKYAIRYFHDENSNKKLDKKFIGIPKEGIGFSNDAYGRFGPKDFEDWLFDVKGNTEIKLITEYY